MFNRPLFMMSSLTTENTSEMPINNRFEANKQYYYIKKLENGREALVVVEVEKRSRNGKSIWIYGYESYCIISHDERGEYIHNRYWKEKLYAADAVFKKKNDLGRITDHRPFTEGFVNVLQKVETDGQGYTNFILKTQRKLRYGISDSVIVGFVRQDTPTTTDYVFQILETVDEFKQEISDNSYKKIVDLLKKIHYL
jgi:hypothetical protein